MLPDGLVAFLGICVGWLLGRGLSNLPNRLVLTQRPLLAVPELAELSGEDAAVARSFPLVQSALFFGGGPSLFYVHLALFPGPIDAGRTFAVFGSLISVLGMARGFYELGLGVGPESHDLVTQGFPRKFLAGSAEVKRRGQLRLAICAASAVFFFLVGGYCRAILGPPLTIILIAALLRIGSFHIADALKTARSTRSSSQGPALVRWFWMLAPGVVLVFGAALLVLAAYLILRFWRAVW